MRRSVLALVVAIATLLSFTSISAAAPAGATTRAIIVLDDAAGDPSRAGAALGRQYGFVVDRVYSHALRGFAAQVPSGRLAALRADPRVAYVELDQVARIYEQTVPTGIQRIFAPENGEIDIDGADDWRVDVDVAVIDTGIDLDHPDLNVFRSVNCSGGSPLKQSCGSGGDDDNNHGTHVAGTIGAIDNGIGVVGVAPGARLWAVKVLRADGSGYISWIIAGIDYVTANAASIEVANMSLGCECSSAAMNTAITNSVAAGVVYAVAAGNSDKDAATFSPANHPDVITVSALADFDGKAGGLVGTSTSPPYCRVDQDDTLADFSNWGSSVEIAAPGVCILSTIPGGYATYSGTSMASPHVAGAAALLASSASSRNPSQIRQTLIAAGNVGWTDEADGFEEPLLAVGDATIFDPVLVSSSGSATNDPPTANFTTSCTDLSCVFTDTSTDGDGSVVEWSWTFGDGTSSTEQNPTHSYATAGTYTVSLTVTDNGGASSSSFSQSVTVAQASEFTLSAIGYKLKGVQHADLTWSGTNAPNVDVYRNGVWIMTTANDGAHTDVIGNKGGGSYVYKVCEAETTPQICSNEATVSF